MPEVCNKFQMLANWAVGGKVFTCEAPPRALEPGISTEASAQYKSEMRWRNVSWPTENQDACLAQGARMLDLRNMKAGETVTEDGFRCIDRASDKVTVDFSVTRACEPDKDPQARGSCTSTVKVKPPAAQ